MVTERRMETGQTMRSFREERKIRFDEMASRCGIGGVLLHGLEEDGWTTHPLIAARVCAEYELDLDDYNTLVCAEYRASKLPKPKPKPGQRGYRTEEPPRYAPIREQVILDRKT